MTRWQAKPHTLAKITILRKYLDAWFSIMGISRSFSGRDLVYIDGFAGPGLYAGGELGSPLTALRSARSAISAQSLRWVAGEIFCVFVEESVETAKALRSELEKAGKSKNVHVHVYEGEFDTAIDVIAADLPTTFGDSPLFAFLDPFGPSDLSFSTVERVLKSKSSEVLLHFDSDGATRMISALRKGHNRESHATLTRVFGNEVWREATVLDANGEVNFSETTRNLLKNYVARLRSVATYAYPFQMITPMGKENSDVGYYLVFASQHRRGIEKMKEAMKSVGTDGEYRFSNFRSGRPMLFVQSSDAAADAELMYSTFRGRQNANWNELSRFTLNETRFINPKALLKCLEKSNRVVVKSPAPRRKYTYPDSISAGMGFDFVEPKGVSNGEEICD